MILITLLVVVFASYIYCQSSDNALDCNMAVEAFNASMDCSLAYEAITSIRDSDCMFVKPILCEGECAERAKRTSCTCHNKSSIVTNIGKACGCQSNITCSIRTDNCGRAVYAFNKDCGADYSTLISSNGSCSSCCSGLCDNENCNKLAKNVSCYCSEMPEGQIIRNINNYCTCSHDCSGSATNLLLSPWILILSLIVAIATLWI